MKHHTVTIEQLAGYEYRSLLAADNSVPKRLLFSFSIGTDGSTHAEFIVEKGSIPEVLDNRFSLEQALERYNSL